MTLNQINALQKVIDVFSGVRDGLLCLVFNDNKVYGICHVFSILANTNKLEMFELNELLSKLPATSYASVYCWTCNKEGDLQRVAWAKELLDE